MCSNSNTCISCLTHFYLKRTVRCHNFKSQNLKLSVSNPKSKSVAYLSVLSQISNCQSLGRKNKHDILKTGRMISTWTPMTFPIEAGGAPARPVASREPLKRYPQASCLGASKGGGLVKGGFSGLCFSWCNRKT